MTELPPDPRQRVAALLHDPRLNKGTAFTEAERETLGLRGLLPPHILTQQEQLVRVLQSFRGKPTPLEKYVYLTALQDRNERLFYRLVTEHIDEMLPIIYTPTVGEACVEFGNIYRRPRGLYLTINDRGRVRDILRNWPVARIGMIVVTDGERILGLGDLGANGMGIPIGKLSLYTACAGVDPELCLPVTLDVGTNRASLLGDPLYLGLQQPRVRGAGYDALVEEFVMAVQEVFPGAVIQFEDFATENALRLLARYRDRVCTFNDDIQGTAAVTLATLYSAGRVTGKSLAEQTVLFLGAGSAATGIGDLVVSAMQREGVTEADARRRCWFVDRGGLVTAARADLADYKRPYAHQHPPAADLPSAIELLRPTALIGVSAQGGGFDEASVRAMARINERPIIFPLSNPTSCSECTAAQAWAWTDGRAVFASGSPFAPVDVGGKTMVPRQANNAYIFPGLGLGLIAAGARRVTESMFHVAARTLAERVPAESLDRGALLPP
ncbi:MAG TPA: NAD-dependent malic enzyme, partial [Gemmatimonadales bacterium]|nr:NAD-dependent malic enzyme [Gemmatimonadales bacterium]